MRKILEKYISYHSCASPEQLFLYEFRPGCIIISMTVHSLCKSLCGHEFRNQCSPSKRAQMLPSTPNEGPPFGHSLEDLVCISHVHLQVIGSEESQLYPRVFYKAGCCPEVEDQRVWRGEVGQIYIEQTFFVLRGKLFGLTSYQRLMRTFVLRKLCDFICFWLMLCGCCVFMCIQLYFCGTTG